MFSAKVLDISKMEKEYFYLIKVEYSNSQKSFIKEYEFNTNSEIVNDIEQSFQTTIEHELQRINDLYNEIPMLLFKIGTEISL